MTTVTIFKQVSLVQDGVNPGINLTRQVALSPLFSATPQCNSVYKHNIQNLAVVIHTSDSG
ncbi:hypothetical protein [Nostoc sp.]|uniref:hypothetical protein n=1 Tax=Nostoc sp. TaxID=1180 RepID=UPI002FF4A01E